MFYFPEESPDWIRFFNNDFSSVPSFTEWMMDTMEPPVKYTEFEVVESKLHENKIDETLVIEEL